MTRQNNTIFVRAISHTNNNHSKIQPQVKYESYGYQADAGYVQVE